MQLYQLAIEIEADECGYHAAVIDEGNAVAHVTNSYPAPEDAERAARSWIARHELPQSA